MAEGSIAEWLDGGGGEDASPGDEPDFWRPDADRAEQEERSRRLWHLAAAFWGLLVLAGAVLLVAGGLTGSPPDRLADAPQEAEVAGAAGAAPDAATGAADGAPDAGTSPPAGTGGTIDPAGPDGAERDRLGALAAVAVRLAMTADDEPARYVDLVEPEAVERHGDVAVVTVAAVVLEGREGRWESVRPARYAVALRDTADGPALLGAPWPLPPPEDADPAPAEAQDLEDPAMAAEITAALGAAGWGEPTAIALLPEAGGAWLRVRVTALAPGEPEARRHDVLLHRGEEMRLAGTSR